MKETAKQASSDAAKLEPDSEEAQKTAAKPCLGLQFHDLRHQAITELGEIGASDATLMAVAGHLSRQMM